VDIKAALEDIIAQAAEDEKDILEYEAWDRGVTALKSVQRQLRMLIKVMASSPPPVAMPAGRFRPDGKFTTKEESHAQTAPEILLRQDDSPRMVECVGGDSAGVVVPVPGDMPNGASTVIGNEVYTMGGGRLEFNTAQTAARNERMKGVET
jgi:hypothetical protein